MKTSLNIEDGEDSVFFMEPNTGYTGYVRFGYQEYLSLLNPSAAQIDL